MKVLMVKPDRKPFTVEIAPGLEALQNMVGGYIQAVYPFDDPVAIICNEEGKLLGLPWNRELRDENGDVYDILCGDFLVVGLGDEDFCGLSDELIEKYAEKFGGPRTFLWYGDDGGWEAIDSEGSV